MNPCENGGICKSRRGKPDKCVCQPMWKGEFCDVAFQPNCDLSPCLNNGKLRNFYYNYVNAFHFSFVKWGEPKRKKINNKFDHSFHHVEHTLEQIKSSKPGLYKIQPMGHMQSIRLPSGACKRFSKYHFCIHKITFCNRFHEKNPVYVSMTLFKQGLCI